MNHKYVIQISLFNKSAKLIHTSYLKEDKKREYTVTGNKSNATTWQSYSLAEQILHKSIPEDENITYKQFYDMNDYDIKIISITNK